MFFHPLYHLQRSIILVWEFDDNKIAKINKISANYSQRKVILSDQQFAETQA
jgi:hypothetical protein